ncbi:DOT1-domain-containing protein [Punctularia strigosozonata HHB-11173 SS5]|uniref:DOT1-domain-containing protein n=1 Tax=Punctularia strigosozonata (strain HHB-11173) TaxID=741275 RepID=UPI0004416F76|nr:DOT1-domain-containing protein [Punctularia strigosozonata HHB-11173 SS5]EIN13327.1 DOT1-domain-containing protein [Punctularia strigosozonata HHB-11173 SS5]
MRTSRTTVTEGVADRRRLSWPCLLLGLASFRRSLRLSSMPPERPTTSPEPLLETGVSRTGAAGNAGAVDHGEEQGGVAPDSQSPQRTSPLSTSAPATLPHTMLATTATVRPSSSDLSFFSKPKFAKAVASTSTSTVVTRVVPVQRPKPPKGHPHAHSPASRGSSVSSLSSLSSSESDASRARSAGPAVTKKRKLLEHEPELERVEPSATKPKKPRQIKEGTRLGRPPKALKSIPRPPSPGRIYRSDRSRSTSTFPVVEAPIPRRCWIEESGEMGQELLSSAKAVRGLMKSYKAYFHPDPKNPKRFEPDPDNPPMVTLEMPNNGAVEEFLLLQPKDPDHYNPIFDLRKTLETIIESYLTPAQQSLFGTLHDSLSRPNTDPDDDDIPVPGLSRSPSPASNATPSRSSPPHSRVSSSSSLSSLTSISSTSSSLSSLSSISVTSSAFEADPNVDYLAKLRHAQNTKDGATYVATLRDINRILRSFKYPRPPPDYDIFDDLPTNIFMDSVKSWTPSGLPKPVALRIIEETYQRAVGPQIPSLRKYEAFSSHVYGELMPSFISDIVAATHLGPDSLFVDLGAGVGNVVLQAALQTGCRAYGIEIMPAPARIARAQLEQFRLRCKMWGVSAGEVEMEEGDMLKSARVSELLSQADVVLVNNKVFAEELNEALRPKFLDLKEGAILVSLKPFVSSLNARLTERNVDDISTIFDVTERPYHSGSVSWGSGGGSYYLHRVDRAGYASIRERFEKSRSARSSRSRR